MGCAQEPLSQAEKTAILEEKEHQSELSALRGLIDTKPLRILAWHQGSSVKEDLQDNERIIHFVRHGEGFHNAFADCCRELGLQFSSQGLSEETCFNPYRLPSLTDPPLTAQGREQASAHVGKANPELVVVSPLTRAIQTALLAFRHLLGQGVPFVAEEDCREQAGVHTCDKRSKSSELQFDFPHVDFSSIEEDDSLWLDNHRESKSAVFERVYSFLSKVSAGTEKEIAVVSHSCWMLTLFQAVLDCQEPGLASWPRTGEMRSLRLRFVPQSS